MAIFNFMLHFPSPIDGLSLLTPAPMLAAEFADHVVDQSSNITILAALDDQQNLTYGLSPTNLAASIINSDSRLLADGATANRTSSAHSPGQSQSSLVKI